MPLRRQGVLVTKVWVTNYSKTQQLTTAIFIPNHLCGLGIQAWFSWVLQLGVSPKTADQVTIRAAVISRANWAQIFQAHSHGCWESSVSHELLD